MEYNKKLVEKAGEVYAQYLIENWRPGPSGMLTDREYRALKKRAMEHLRKVLPSMNLFYVEWLKLVSEHGPAKAHSHVTTTAQETGRRVWIGLSQATQIKVLNTSNRMVINPDGSVKGKRKTFVVDEEEPEPEPVSEKPQEATKEQHEIANLNALKWRLLDCAIHTGIIPNEDGVAALYEVSRQMAEVAVEWLRRFNNLERDESKGFYRVSPKQLDAHKLLELFHNKERNPFELRALEALLDAMAE